MAELWYGGTIYTMEQEGEQVEAVVTKNGRIQMAGSLEEVMAVWKGAIDQEHHLQGQVMYPGFVDSHLHIIGHGERLLRLDLSFMTSPEEVKEALSSHASQLPHGQWLIGEGWNENQWADPRIIHKSELDEISTEHPIMLTRVCRHALLANSKAMELAGVTEDTEDPQGGKIVRDEHGLTTGYFLDAAQDPIKDAMPEYTQSYLEKAISVSIEDLTRNGIVGGHSEDLNYYGGFRKTYDAFLNSIGPKHTKFRAHLLVHHEVLDDMLADGLTYKSGTEFVELGAVKIFSDGAIGGRTALLSESYEDDKGNRGMAIHEEKQLAQIVKKARKHDLPVAVHAIGDEAVAMITRILNGVPDAPHRDRIIHAQFMRDELYDQVSSTNAIVDIQPTFVSSDFPWVLDRIGEHRLQNAYPWKKLLQSGIPCAGGSDAPIEEINPLLAIQAAVTRKSIHDQKAYGIEQCLTMFEAISLYTKGSAYTIHEEGKRGLIKEGYDADFTIFDRDLFALHPDRLLEANVTRTVVDGTVVYQR
ncbi:MULTISPECIES: amidohydrolase [Pontibacillus]|uniref:Amidohydrolase n=1 Tax=Pontibacillus chungwhensis TaxID=265426 RepID=A0ABY8UXK6_9BACI|nr:MULTISPECIES: amidohydrolase [Pontibacillus]MCD5323869.1 amidohydrolase [Pontibacillus sp. HN14]WIF97229.1 amidohydrolase [Pontibacillus chungwhensis]